jgi:hypothetical protein
MPLSDEVKALFDDKVKPSEILSKIEEAFDARENEFAKNKSKVNAEAQALRKHKIALERLAKEHGVEKLDDPDDFVNEIQGKLKGSTEKNSTIEQQLKLIQKKLEDADNAAKAATAKARDAGVKAKAQADFAKHLHASGLHLNQAIANGLTLADDGETLIWKDGDDVVDYQKGLAKYIAEHKDDARNLQQPGAGSTKGKRVSSKNNDTLTQAEFDSMSGIEKAKYAKEHPGWSISG